MLAIDHRVGSERHEGAGQVQVPRLACRASGPVTKDKVGDASDLGMYCGRALAQGFQIAGQLMWGASKTGHRGAAS